MKKICLIENIKSAKKLTLNGIFHEIPIRVCPEKIYTYFELNGIFFNQQTID